MFGELIYGLDMFGQPHIYGLGPHHLFIAEGFHEVYPFECILTLSYSNTLLLISS